MMTINLALCYTYTITLALLCIDKHSGSNPKGKFTKILWSEIETFHVRMHAAVGITLKVNACHAIKDTKVSSSVRCRDIYRPFFFLQRDEPLLHVSRLIESIIL